jgi:hypothetical protein
VARIDGRESFDFAQGCPSLHLDKVQRESPARVSGNLVFAVVKGFGETDPDVEQAETTA